MNALESIVKRLMGTPENLTSYMFVRAEGFYFLDLGSDEEAKANAKCNPGTLKVINAIEGTTVWTNSSNN